MAAALLWVLTQTAMYALPAIAAPAPGERGPRAIVICTGSGLETITLNEDGTPAKAPAKNLHCPWCAQLGGVGQIVADTPALTAPEAVLIGRITWNRGGQFAGARAARPYESRAPPCT
ncbi:MAG: DUF2946 domain-containing protein [Alphaproteobacteria bacterium]|nr:MAG: DUF2946 domain-containing protein [Alphaproteobacteria bacterium]